MPALVLPWHGDRTRAGVQRVWGGWGTTTNATLFIAAASAGVNVYSRNGHQQGQITGFGNPVGLAVDASGNLYVADDLDDVVDVFAPGAKMPFEALQDGSDSPTDVAVGADGTVYASNVTNGSPGSISVWAPGNTTPSGHITDSHVFNFIGVALDAKNNLYAAWYTDSGIGGVDKVRSGSTTPANLGLQDLHVPLGIKVDSHKALVIADAGDASVKVYPRGSTIPARTITGFEQPSELAFDVKEKSLYVTDAEAASAVVLRYGAGTVKKTITAGLSASNYPWGVALNPAAPL
jgi:hypothetical protein